MVIQYVIFRLFSPEGNGV